MRALAVVVAVGLAAGGCSSLGSDGGARNTPTPAAAAADLGQKPEIELDGSQPPPAELVVEDVVAGEGEAAAAGDTVTIDYVIEVWSTDREVDASWDHERPYTFEVGAGQVIAGLDQGVAGMQVGGRRRIVVPPDLAYGDRGTPTIGAGETLVFLVDLRAVGGVGSQPEGALGGRRSQPDQSAA